MPKPKQFFVIAHNIRSVLNVGSIFRTADAFGVTKLFLTGYTATPSNPISGHKIAKTALGAERFVSWEHNQSAIRVINKLKKDYPHVSILGLENNVPDGLKSKLITLSKFKPKFPVVLILGEEVEGISSTLVKVCDQLIEIPMVGQKESLNVSVAFGIAAYYVLINSKFLSTQYKK